MARSLFVGRDAELRRVLEVLQQAGTAKGAVVLVEGKPGVGKSHLLRQLREAAPRTPGLEKAVFASGRCYRGMASQSAYQPFVEILSDLAHAIGTIDRFQTGFGALIKEVGPDWLRAIPLIGSVLGAGAKTVLAAEVVLMGEPAEARAASLVRQYKETIERVARDGTLLVLVIDDAQWMDHASSDLLLRLSDDLTSIRLAVILSGRPTGETQDDPMGKLRLELASRKRIEVVRLEGLSEDEVGALLQGRFGTQFQPELATWLMQLCDGQPLFVAQYLDLLEQAGVITHDDDGFHFGGTFEREGEGWKATGRLAELPISEDIVALLDLRIGALREEEREMLQIGSVQGQYFDSVILGEVSETRELTVLSQLRRLSERDGIIERYRGSDWLADRSDAYAFEHVLMHDAFYRKLRPREQALYHEAVSRALESLLPSFEVPPRKLLIEIANHARKGGRPSSAAGYYLRAAQDCYEDGATVEAMHLCRDAIECLDALPPGSPDRDALLADAVILHLVCGAHGSVDRATNEAMLTMAADGEAAAERAARPTVLAVILALKGHLYVRAGRVPEAVAVMHRAVAKAREIGDPLAEFIALAQLGSQLAKEDLVESVAIRREAQDLFERRVSVDLLPSAQRELLLREHSSLLVLIGLGEFDLGDVETGIAWMERGLKEMRTRHMFDEQLAALNYLAQAFASIGLYETALQHLEDSIRLEAEHGHQTANPWVGYNLGLKAHVLFEIGPRTSAAETMRDAVRISEAAEHMDLLTLVWNYQAELLLGDDAAGAALDAAAQVLEKNLAAATAAGLRPSEARAASLMGQVMLRRGLPEKALEFSERAVASVAAFGDMPAVRTEEIHFNHWLVLRACDRREDALRSLDAARKVVERKAALLKEPEHRMSYLERVRTIRQIVDAYRSESGSKPGIVDLNLSGEPPS